MALSIKNRVSRISEELFPFIFFWLREKKKLKEATDLNIKDTNTTNGNYSKYFDLDEEALKDRLSEERERAKTIDEKTIKLTLPPSIGLSILGTTSSFLTKVADYYFSKLLIAFFSAGAVFYTLMGGLLALGALKTLPAYGFGTNFRLNVKGGKKFLVHALAGQETINIIRQLRNEAVYQCLRNGLLCLLLALVVFGITHLVNLAAFGAEIP